MSEPIDLFAERERISAELGRLAVVDTPVRDGEAAVAAIDREVAALDADERATWLAWGAAPDGEPPALRISERRALAQRRAESAADLDAARVAAAAVAPRRTALNIELTRIGREMFRARLAECLAEGIRLNGEAHAIIEQIRDPLSRVSALRSALLTISSAKANAGEKALEHELILGAEKIAGLPLPNVSFDGATLNKHAAEWLGKLH
jgi:hypothetical protein